MLGLIKKDLLMVKNNTKLIVVMLLMFFIMASQGQFDISFILPFISVMVFISTFSYDEYNKWDAYAICLPNGRKNVVKSKYVASIILTLASIVVAVLLNLLLCTINDSLNLDELISALTGSLFAATVIQAVMFPVIFKYGIEKGRIGIFVVSFGVVGIAGILSKVMHIDVPVGLVSLIENYWFIILPVMIVVMIVVSYKISERIYMKKEF